MFIAIALIVNKSIVTDKLDKKEFKEISSDLLEHFTYSKFQAGVLSNVLSFFDDLSLDLHIIYVLKKMCR